MQHLTGVVRHIRAKLGDMLSAQHLLVATRGEMEDCASSPLKIEIVMTKIIVLQTHNCPSISHRPHVNVTTTTLEAKQWLGTCVKSTVSQYGIRFHVARNEHERARSDGNEC
jgi:hypothetical protein